MKLPTHISYILKKSFYLLSWKSLSCIKFLNLEYFQMRFKSFQNPFHLFKMEEVMSSSLQGFVMKRIWINRDQNAKRKLWESPFIPAHLTFKRFWIHSLSVNQSNNQSNLSVYYNIPKFRILGCYRRCRWQTRKMLRRRSITIARGQVATS